MSGNNPDRDPVEALAEEFLARKRQGENPTIDEYTERYPDLAEQIRDLFPALAMMEDLKPPADSTSGSERSGEQPSRISRT